MNPIAELLRVALSAAIATSAEARHCSERLAGKTIAVESGQRRLVIHLEPGAARVEAGDEPADATLRGSMAAVLAALAGKRDDTAAIFGDEELFNDFRSSFRPHMHFPPAAKHFAEDAGDAMRVGVGAVRSAFQAVTRVVRDYLPDRLPGFGQRADADLAREVAALKERVARLEQHLPPVDESSPPEGGGGADQSGPGKSKSKDDPPA